MLSWMPSTKPPIEAFMEAIDNGPSMKAFHGRYRGSTSMEASIKASIPSVEASIVCYQVCATDNNNSTKNILGNTWDSLPMGEVGPLCRAECNLGNEQFKTDRHG